MSIVSFSDCVTWVTMLCNRCYTLHLFGKYLQNFKTSAYSVVYWGISVHEDKDNNCNCTDHSRLSDRGYKRRYRFLLTLCGRLLTRPTRLTSSFLYLVNEQPWISAFEASQKCSDQIDGYQSWETIRSRILRRRLWWCWSQYNCLFCTLSFLLWKQNAHWRARVSW